MIRLEGPRAVRKNEDARKGIPMSAAEVRQYIDEIESAIKQKETRKRMAELALIHGNISPEGRAVWREYLKLISHD